MKKEFHKSRFTVIKSFKRNYSMIKNVNIRGFIGK